MDGYIFKKFKNVFIKQGFTAVSGNGKNKGPVDFSVVGISEFQSKRPVAQ